jgi:DNA primase
MPKRIPRTELQRLRNDIDVTAVVDHLDIPWKIRDGYFRFLCPQCSDFHTATNPRTNLARCFRCQQNFNPIDLVMAVEKKSFLQAVRYLRQHGARMQPPSFHRRA